MATHSSVLAWRIQGTGEPRGLPSMGVSQSQTRLKQLSSSEPSELTMSLRKCLEVFQVLSVHSFVCASQQYPWVTIVILVLQIRKLRARVRG